MAALVNRAAIAPTVSITSVNNADTAISPPICARMLSSWSATTNASTATMAKVLSS